jgi:outer membrane protein TolC
LRPIFLTTMAAAVGVIPMIVSGSSLWGPLASVIAVGLVSSMFFTLIVVPVLFVLVKSRVGRPAAGVAAGLIALAALLVAPAQAATRALTLDEAVDLALKQNRGLKIARARVREQQAKSLTARADYFPQLSTDLSMLGQSDKGLVTVPAGSLGHVPGLGPFPTEPITFDQGSSTILLGSNTLAQPLTQMFKIRQGVRVAEAGERISEAELKKAEDQVILGVHQLYYGILGTRKQTAALRAQIAAGEASLRDARTAVQAGNALDVVILGARAALLRNRQALLAAENQASDYTAELNDLLGLPLATDLELADVAAAPDGARTREEYLKTALDRSPELDQARQTVSKARAGVKAARYEYIPNLGAFARQTYHRGVPFLAHNFGTFGFQMTWSVFDWGKRRGVVQERESLLTQAEENERRMRDRIAVDVEKAWRKLDRTRMMMEVAREALALRQESERIVAQQLKVGVSSEAKAAEAVAATRAAEADELQARLAHQLALAEMARLTGERK